MDLSESSLLPQPRKQLPIGQQQGALPFVFALQFIAHAHSLVVASTKVLNLPTKCLVPVLPWACFYSFTKLETGVFCMAGPPEEACPG